MTSNSFYDTFKTSLEAMKENSVLPLLTTDKDYQNYTNQESMAEAQYIRFICKTERNCRATVRRS